MWEETVIPPSSQEITIALTDQEEINEFLTGNSRFHNFLKPGSHIHSFQVYLETNDVAFVSISKILEELQHVTVRYLSFTRCMFDEKDQPPETKITVKEVRLDSCVYVYNAFHSLCRIGDDGYNDVIEKITLTNIGTTEPPGNGFRTWTRDGELLILMYLGQAIFCDHGRRIRYLDMKELNEKNFRHKDETYVGEVSQYIKRNKEVYEICRKDCLTLMMIKKYTNEFYYIPKDVVLRIAQYLWRTRYENIWYDNHFLNFKKAVEDDGVNSDEFIWK